MVVAMAAALALGAAGCGGSGTVRRSIDAAAVGDGAGFVPPEITVDKGDEVRLTVRNATARTHGFSIEGYGIRREVDSPIEVRFTASKAGTYKIFCQLHPAHQTATLVVQ